MKKVLKNSIWILILAGLLSACGERGPAGDEPIGKPEDTSADERSLAPAAPEELPGRWRELLPSWSAYYSKQVEDWDSLRFEPTDTWQEEIWIVQPQPQRPQWEDLFLDKLPAAPGGGRVLDVISYEVVPRTSDGGRTRFTAAGPDSEAAIVNLNTGERQRLLFCGTPCRFEAGAWVDTGQVLVAGLAEGDDGAFHPALWQVHLPTHSIRQYLAPATYDGKKGNFLMDEVFQEPEN